MNFIQSTIIWNCKTGAKPSTWPATIKEALNYHNNFKSDYSKGKPAFDKDDTGELVFSDIPTNFQITEYEFINGSVGPALKTHYLRPR
jgi:hypothetical protein